MEEWIRSWGPNYECEPVEVPNDVSAWDLMTQLVIEDIRYAMENFVINTDIKVKFSKNGRGAAVRFDEQSWRYRIVYKEPRYVRGPEHYEFDDEPEID